MTQEDDLEKIEELVTRGFHFKEKVNIKKQLFILTRQVVLTKAWEANLIQICYFLKIIPQ